MTGTNGDLRVLGQDAVAAILAGRERDVVERVRAAYVAHRRGETSLPHSTFLRFPGRKRERIIALPAYLGGEAQVAGIKWIASFPDNVSRGVARASATILLNDVETGRPHTLLEGGLISATRTAASAALAGRVLHPEADPPVGLVGGGRINFEIVHYLHTLLPRIPQWRLFDLDAARGREFAERCCEAFPGVTVELATSLDELLRSSRLVSFATTAVDPYLDDPSACSPGTTLLHVSLRDLTAKAMLTDGVDHVVDDLDHVCRAQTSIHLAAEEIGHRDFVRAEIGAVLTGEAEARPDPRGITVFSPFGLGILDLVLAEWITREARDRELGTLVSGFLSDTAGSWG